MEELDQVQLARITRILTMLEDCDSGGLTAEEIREGLARFHPDIDTQTVFTDLQTIVTRGLPLESERVDENSPARWKLEGK